MMPKTFHLLQHFYWKVLHPTQVQHHKGKKQLTDIFFQLRIKIEKEDIRKKKKEWIFWRSPPFFPLFFCSVLILNEDVCGSFVQIWSCLILKIFKDFLIAIV